MLYKITLNDAKCVSFSSDIVELYVEDIEKFKEEWFQLEQDESRKERFLRSLNGETVSDCFSDDAFYNIVQKDKNAKILSTETLRFENEKFGLENMNGKNIIYTNEAYFFLKRIRYENEFLLLASYELKGVYHYNDFIGGYSRQGVYGNKILQTEYHSNTDYGDGKPNYDITDTSNFKNDKIRSISDIPVKAFLSERKMNNYHVTKEDLCLLMSDIVGNKW